MIRNFAPNGFRLLLVIYEFEFAARGRCGGAHEHRNGISGFWAILLLFLVSLVYINIFYPTRLHLQQASGKEEEGARARVRVRRPRGLGV